MAQNDSAIAKLARQIDAARQTERFLVDADEVAALRRRGAADLYAVCAEFVSSVNANLSHAVLEISPETYAPETFQDSGANLIQISSQGRVLQITFRATPQLFSTEKFRVPYVLEGEVRTYNQQMLERFEVRSLLLFFCVDEDSAVWRIFDWRRPRTAPVDRALLVELMGRLF